jgi:hypothetical protein
MSNLSHLLSNIKEITALPETSINSNGIVYGSPLLINQYISARIVLSVLVREAGSIGFHSVEFCSNQNFATGVKSFVKDQLAPNSIFSANEPFTGDDVSNIAVSAFDQSILSAVGKTSIQFDFDIVNSENYKYFRVNTIGSGTPTITFSLSAIFACNEKFTKIA